MSKTKIKNSKARSAELLTQALEVLRHGGVIVFPTETFYGLGADAFNAAAVERVVAIKGRDPTNPIPLIVADEKMLRDTVTEIPPAARRLMERFWPGPLTLVLPARKGLPESLLNHSGGVGVRISSHAVPARLVGQLGHPLTATSANPSGRDPSRTIAEARRYFSAKLKIFLDGGRLAGRKGSTVVEVFQDEVRTIREGEISREELARALAPPH